MGSGESKPDDIPEWDDPAEMEKERVKEKRDREKEIAKEAARLTRELHEIQATHNESQTRLESFSLSRQKPAMSEVETAATVKALHARLEELATTHAEFQKESERDRQKNELNITLRFRISHLDLLFGVSRLELKLYLQVSKVHFPFYLLI